MVSSVNRSSAPADAGSGVVSHCLVNSTNSMIMDDDTPNNLVSTYSEMQDNLRAIICSSVPYSTIIDDASSAIFVAAYSEERMLRDEVNNVKQILDKAEKRENKSEDEINVLRAQLREGEARLKQAEDATYTAAIPVLAVLQDHEVFSDGSLDDVFVSYMVLSDATPKGLATFSDFGHNVEKKALIDEMLDDTRLMKQILVAGGPVNGDYGGAMEIYNRILRSSSNALQEGSIFSRLALGTSLEHANPIKIFDTQRIIDPVDRYLHYERAYLDGELDPAFENMTAWECRWITNSDASDEEAAWGREMLRNYRPDLIFSNGYDWRYCQIVRSDVRYKRPEWTSTPRTYQQMISGGGQCGPRAWFGRYVCRNFGIPTWGVRQPGHAAMSHWTPNGWIICLGGGSRHNLWGGWHKSWWGNRNAYDFLMEAEARMIGGWSYIKVLRLRWLSCALGEKKCDIFSPSGFWSALAAMQQKALVMNYSFPRERVAVGQNSRNIWFERANSVAWTSDHDPSAQEFCRNRSIFVPIEDCRMVQGSGQKVLVFRSFQKVGTSLMQMHQKADGKFEFDIDISSPGEYMFSARVVTVQNEQHPLQLSVTGNGSFSTEYCIDIPYTRGKWKTTPPIKIMLSRGRFTFKFSRDVNSLGMSIRYFQLDPIFLS